ncbi:hypothetical protein K7432_010567, partial [Basidiobolus ranarum]
LVSLALLRRSCRERSSLYPRKKRIQGIPMEGDKSHPAYFSSGNSFLNPQTLAYTSEREAEQEYYGIRPVRPQSEYLRKLDAGYSTEIEPRRYQKETITPDRSNHRYPELQRLSSRADSHPSRMMGFPTPISPASPSDQVIMSHRRFSVRECSAAPSPIEPPKLAIRSRLGQDKPLSWDALNYDESVRRSLLSPENTPTRGFGPCDYAKNI